MPDITDGDLAATYQESRDRRGARELRRDACDPGRLVAPVRSRDDHEVRVIGLDVHRIVVVAALAPAPVDRAARYDAHERELRAGRRAAWPIACMTPASVPPSTTSTPNSSQSGTTTASSNCSEACSRAPASRFALPTTTSTARGRVISSWRSAAGRSSGRATRTVRAMWPGTVAAAEGRADGATTQRALHGWAKHRWEQPDSRSTTSRRRSVSPTRRHRGPLRGPLPRSRPRRDRLAAHRRRRRCHRDLGARGSAS